MPNETFITASQVEGQGDPSAPPAAPGSMPPVLGEIPPVSPGGPGNITGLVFNDMNLNGMLDGEESAVSGAGVALIDINTGAAVESIADSTGTYSFNGVFPSTYILRTAFELPQTQTNSSPIIVISPDPADLANNVIINLGSTVPQNVGNVAGVKYFDANGSGVLDEGEPGLPNFTIYADTNYNGILDVGEPFTVTGLGGQYFLPNLPATRLTIREFQVEGVSQTSNPSPTVDIIPGETIAGVNIPSGEPFAGVGSRTPLTMSPVPSNINFGNTPQVAIIGEIGGTVFNDINANSQADPGEAPLPGAALYIDSNGNFIQDPGERTTVTDNTGRYSFPGLFIDSFIVREVPPPGFAKTVPDPVVTLTVQNPINDAVNFANVVAPLPPPPPPAPVPPAPPVVVPGPTGPDMVAAMPVPETNGEETSVVPETQVTEDVSGDASVDDSGEAIVDDTSTTDGENMEATRASSQVAGGAASIAGTLFQDFNANQLVEPEEPGAGGITVFLDTNNNNVIDEGEATSISDATGQYVFAGLQPGNYVVQVDGVTPTTPPPVITLVAGDDANFVNIGVPGIAPPPGPVPPVPPPGPVPPDVVVPPVPVAIPDSLLVQRGVITGGKFDDRNGNGFFEPDEPARSGITIYLDLNDSGQLDPGEPNTVTDANGLYRFEGLPPSIYRVREVLQPGEVQTSVGPKVTLVPGQTVVYNFANTTIFGQPEFSSSISGLVYEDTNGNGVLEPGVEPGFSGIQIYVDLNANSLLDVEEPFTFTDEKGEYIFRALPPGTYTLRQNLSPSQQTQIQQVLPDPLVSDAQIVTLTVPNDNPSGINFANGFKTLGANTISGIVFNDLNGNQLYEPFEGETGIPGIEVFLDTNNDRTPQGFEPNQVTGAGGVYGFDVTDFNVAEGTYNLRTFVRGGFFPTTGDVAIQYTAGESFIYNFGLAPQGIISGKVFDDFNGNGLLDSGEPIGIPDVQIYVDTNNNGVFEPTEPNTFSNINGNYAIVGVTTPGTYTIRQIPRTDLIKTTPDVTVEVGVNQNFTFNIGNSRTQGPLPPAGGELTSIGGTVFEDRNLNQLVEPDEPGLPGFTVYLDLNQNSILDEGEPTSMTDPTGRYDFVNLPVLRDDSGNLLAYVVREVPQPGFTQTTPDAVVTLVEGESANFVNIGNALGAPPATDPLTNPATPPPTEEVITMSSFGAGSGVIDDNDSVSDFMNDTIALAASDGLG
jgi:uncharacterized protein (DUF2141 family)